MVCTVYSVDMRPINKIRSERALVMVMENKAYMIDKHEKAFRSVSAEFPAPSKIMVKRYIPLPRDYYKPAPLGLHNLKARDEYTCQYCGRDRLGPKEFWTIDHIIPTSRGGKHRWENVALSCNTCNNKKGALTPEEAKMPLLAAPRVPFKWEILLDDVS